MASPTSEQVLDRLRGVKAPDLNGNIVDRGLVSEVLVKDGKVMFSIAVPAADARRLEPLRQAAEKVVREIDGVKGVLAVLTAEKQASSNKAPPPRPAQQAHSHAGHSHATHAHATPGQAAPRPQKVGVPGVGAIVAVASGKGGVGKSTTAVNLALGLNANGLSVGILDADIYGPSMPRLLGISGRPQTVSGRTMRPMEGWGLKVMSMGFLVEEDTPMIWRGPMVMSALTQMLREVEWGELDVMVVDMPPGTGDAQLTMAQQVPLAGAVIVSTPQDLALIDARKGLKMFKRVEVPVLGIVENMSYFVCSNCGTRHDIFGHGGARSEAARIGVPFLGEVPLDIAIRQTSDAGRPVVATQPDGPHARAFRDIAANVWRRVEEERVHAPAIVFD